VYRSRYDKLLLIAAHRQVLPRSEWLNKFHSPRICKRKINKCIGDDTKASARQSLNCIKNQKITYGEERFSIWRMEFLHPAMWHVALESWQWIHQVAAPYNVIRGSGMTCHWIRPNVRHIGILHLVFISTHHRSRHAILYRSPKFYPNRTTLGRKNDVMSSFKMADLSHLGF